MDLPPLLTRDDIAAGLEAVRAEHGPWQFHNVQLPFGLFTLGTEPKGDNHRALKFLQLAADTLRRPLASLRVLDLGCGEGLYALEFGQAGAEVVAIEGRDSNLARCEFARRALALPNVRFDKGDVREVSLKSHGRFDLILCSGILYHLDHPAAFELLKALRPMCDGGALFVDTRVALTPEMEATFEGASYWGLMYREHAPDASEAQKLADTGASLDNEHSFWFTRWALANYLGDLGFTSVSETLLPAPLMLRADRVCFVACAGRPVRPYSEVGYDLARRRWPDRYVG